MRVLAMSNRSAIKEESVTASLGFSEVIMCIFCCTKKQIGFYLIIPCPVSDGIFGFLQDLIHGLVSCAPFPNQSALIQYSYDGSAVAITPNFDPAIFNPASDIGIFFSEVIRRDFSCFDGPLGRWRRRIDQMEAKGNGMFAKSVVRHGWTGAFGDQSL